MYSTGVHSLSSPSSSSFSPPPSAALASTPLLYPTSLPSLSLFTHLFSSLSLPPFCTHHPFHSSCCRQTPFSVYVSMGQYPGPPRLSWYTLYGIPPWSAILTLASTSRQWPSHSFLFRLPFVFSVSTSLLTTLSLSLLISRVSHLFVSHIRSSPRFFALPSL